MGIRCADHVTSLYPQKLALTSPTGGGRSIDIVRSQTKATEFLLCCTKVYSDQQPCDLNKLWNSGEWDFLIFTCVHATTGLQIGDSHGGAFGLGTRVADQKVTDSISEGASRIFSDVIIPGVDSGSNRN